ncbi:P27 family phage terminase small subunit [Acidaminococcus massiliensis]|uniref:P27 family phage terminase small subunit n=3 Tax=Acidaminococcus TaxID=904 RepID=UPI001E372E37|nr:P27 family phage terminase small subunit [Acidaminococcus massiliensis]
MSNAPSASRRGKKVYKLSIPVSKDTPGDLRENRGWGYPDRTAPLKKRIIFKKEVPAMPGRPACSVKATRHAMTKEEKAIRTSIEDAGKGLELPATPPKDMSTAEKRIYRWLYRNLQENRFLGQLDIETMKEACFIIAGLHTINVEIRNDPTKLTDRDICAARKNYFEQYLKICHELCLSPAARAKMGTLAVSAHKQEKDPLLKILGGKT